MTAIDESTPGHESPSTKAATAAGTAGVMLVFFGSDLCSLIDEVVWVRLLKLTLGNTIYASSIVVSTFLGGLALGALLMGCKADSLRRPLRLYAAVEVLVTVAALTLPWFLALADRGYGWFFVHYQASPGSLVVLQVIVSATMLLLPTILMGSTLPLLGRYVTPLSQSAGRQVGALYALNTLGATLGCFLAGFVLIRSLGVMGTLYFAAAVNLVVALAGWVLSQQYERDGEAAMQAIAAPAVDLPTSRLAWWQSCSLAAAFLVSGLVSIGYELVWMRSLSLLLGSFTYVFSAVLTVYLLGNVVGAWIASRVARRLRTPAVGFGLSLACLGLCGILYVPTYSWWFIAGRAGIRSGVEGLAATWNLGKAIGPLFHSAVLFLLPAGVMGIGFPWALEAWNRYHRDVGRTAGAVYGANTIGAVFGGLITGFVLIPWLGVQGTIMLLGLLAIVVGGLLTQVFTSGRMAVRGGYLAITLALVASGLLVPSGLFMRRAIRSPAEEMLALQEGMVTTIAITRQPDHSLIMTLDNISMAGDDIHRSAQKMLGHLCLLLHPQAKEALAIGFGGGETTACLAQHDLKRIDCVEIAPEVVQAALKFFSHINLGSRLTEKVNMMYMDAKNYLKLTDKSYDVIINDSNVHVTAESTPLFTREHFQNALNHLKPGGLFITKLHLRVSSKSDFDSIVGTFLQVFPHTSLWFPTTKPYIFFYLVGSREAQSFAPQRIDEELAKENVRKSVEYLHFSDSAAVLSCYVGDQEDLRAYLGDFHINSDYAPFLEFNLDQVKRDIPEYLADFLKIVRRNSLGRHLDLTGIAEPQRTRWDLHYRQVYKASTHILRVHGTTDLSEELLGCFDGLQAMPDNETLLELESQILEHVKGALDHRQADAKEVDRWMAALLQIRPNLGAAWLIKSWMLQQKGDHRGAMAAGQQAARDAPHNAAAGLNHGDLLIGMGKAEEAAEQYRKVLKISPASAEANFGLGAALAGIGRGDEAIPRFQAALDIKPDYFAAHLSLATVLHQNGRLDEAIRHYQRALEIDAGSVEAHNDLGNVLSQQGRFDEAIPHYQLALEINPGCYTATYANLGRALYQQRDVVAALGHLRQRIRLNHDNIPLLCLTAWVLATSPEASNRNAAEAVELAGRAWNLAHGQNPMILDTLAAAYAEAGRFAEAGQAAKIALDLTSGQGNKLLTEAIQARIELYRAGSAFRDTKAARAVSRGENRVAP
jgi:spermidine synthase